MSAAGKTSTGHEILVVYLKEQSVPKFDILVLQACLRFSVVWVIVRRLAVVFALQPRHLHDIFLLRCIAIWQEIGLRLSL